MGVMILRSFLFKYLKTMLYFTGSHLFPHFTQGKQLLYLISVNHLRSSAAHDDSHGHFCRGSIELTPLPGESLVAAPR